MQHFHKKLSEANVKTNRWGVQNGSIRKNGVLAVAKIFFRKLCFSLITSYKELI